MLLHDPLAVVTPTLDGRVLAVLARTDAVFTTGQLHRLLPDASEDGIRRVLQRLAVQGIVLADRVGNAYAYRFNHDHLAAEHVVGLANQTSDLLTRLTALFRDWDPAPVYAAVFGSAARGTMTVSSDIDLLLVRPGDADETAWEDQTGALSSAVTRWTGNDARALVVEESEVGPDEPVLRDVLAYGLTVAGTHDWLAQRLRRKAAKA